MTRQTGLIASIPAVIFFVACLDNNKPTSDRALESGFITPPDSIQTGIYWYWISDNISKEGGNKRPSCNEKAGMNRAFIGNIGLDDVPYGK